MFSAFREVAPKRMREGFGLDFEDFAVGQVFHHRPGISVTQQDNIDEALATLNQAAVHYDHHYAAQTEFAKPLFVSTLTLQRAVGMGWKTYGRRKRILGFREIRLIAPVFGGDTLYARSRVLEVADTDDDPACGRVAAEITVAREDRTDIGIIVAEMLIHRRGRGPYESANF